MVNFDKAGLKNIVEDKMDIFDVYKKVNEIYPKEGYDHRPFLPSYENLVVRQMQMTELYRIEYACFRRALVNVLQVTKIVEVGVRSGTSALAFLDSRKEAEYLGIDNNLDSITDDVDYCANAKFWFKELKYNARILEVDSQSLWEFPIKPDFVHIDGDHSRKGAAHDLIISIRSGAKWVLVDDAAVPDVCCGIYDAAFQEFKGIAPPMCRFDQTYGQSVLIQNIKGAT